MKKYFNFIIEKKNQNVDGNELFVNAAKNGSSTIIKNLLKVNVDINYQNKELNTALILACDNNYLAIVKLLLENGADTNITNKHNRTALHVSSTSKIINLLLEYGVNVNIKSNLGFTAIMEYVGNMSSVFLIDLLSKFLKKGLDLSIKNNKDENFYDILKKHTTYYTDILKKEEKTDIKNVIEFMDKNFPQYKDEWQMRQDVNKYNI